MLAALAVFAAEPFVGLPQAKEARQLRVVLDRRETIAVPVCRHGRQFDEEELPAAKDVVEVNLHPLVRRPP